MSFFVIYEHEISVKVMILAHRFAETEMSTAVSIRAMRYIRALFLGFLRQRNNMQYQWPKCSATAVELDVGVLICCIWRQPMEGSGKLLRIISCTAADSQT